MGSRNALACALIAVVASAALAAERGESIFSRNQPATLCIEVTGLLYNGKEEIAGRGSAFFLNDQRSALTDSHILPDANLYKSIRISGKVRSDDDKPDLTVILTLKSKDATRDLALLEADAPIPSQYVVQGDSRKVKPGAELVVIGCPLSFGPTMTTGHVGNVKDDPLGRWIVDAPINPGNSGGPVLTADGELIGIAWGGVRKTAEGVPIYGLNFVIPIHQAIDGLLREQSVKIFKGPSLLASSAGVQLARAASSPPLTMGRPSSARAGRLAIGSAAIASVPLAVERLGVPAGRGGGSLPGGIEELARPPIASPPAPSGLPPPSNRIARAFEVRELKEDHPSMLPSSEIRTLTFAADPGFKFTEFKFDELSRNHGSPPQIVMSADGREIAVSFSLTSGPMFDRYRGWLTGTLLTRQVRQ
jgi:S1-C subfamily serine protease